MVADDDGFINNPKAIMRQIGATDDDMKILLTKRYLLTFDSGIVVIKHWKINNNIQRDRYKETTYFEEKKLITTDNKNAYIFIDEKPIKSIQNDYLIAGSTEEENPGSTDTESYGSTGTENSGYTDKVSIDKISIVKDSIVNNICATTSEEVATPTKYKFKCKPSKRNGLTEWVLSQEDLDWYIDTYPNLNIDLELKKMWRWLKENNLKTYSGMGRFVSSWLSRANNSTPNKKAQEIDIAYKEARIKEINNKTKNNLDKTNEMFERAENLVKSMGGTNDNERCKITNNTNQCILPYS